MVLKLDRKTPAAPSSTDQSAQEGRCHLSEAYRGAPFARRLRGHASRARRIPGHYTVSAFQERAIARDPRTKQGNRGSTRQALDTVRRGTHAEEADERFIVLPARVLCAKGMNQEDSSGSTILFADNVEMRGRKCGDGNAGTA